MSHSTMKRAQLAAFTAEHEINLRVLSGADQGSSELAGSVIQKAVIDALYQYRKHCANSSSAGQLVLPEQLKLLPLLSLTLMKSPALRYPSILPSLGRLSVVAGFVEGSLARRLQP